MRPPKFVVGDMVVDCSPRRSRVGDRICEDYSPRLPMYILGIIPPIMPLTEVTCALMTLEEIREHRNWEKDPTSKKYLYYASRTKIDIAFSPVYGEREIRKMTKKEIATWHTMIAKLNRKTKTPTKGDSKA